MVKEPGAWACATVATPAKSAQSAKILGVIGFSKGEREFPQPITNYQKEATAFPRLAGRSAATDKALAACSPQLGPGAEVNGVTIRPEPWSPDQPVNGIVLDGFQVGKLVWAVTAEIHSNALDVRCSPHLPQTIAHSRQPTLVLFESVGQDFSQSDECFSIAILTSWLRVLTPAFRKSS